MNKLYVKIKNIAVYNLLTIFKLTLCNFSLILTWKMFSNSMKIVLRMAYI